MNIRKLIAFALLIIGSKADAQIAKSKLFRDPGIYLGGNWSKGTEVTLVPQAWFYLNDFYIEARYNYEDEKSFSTHLGLPIDVPEINMEITPTVGLVFGNYEGMSIGLNTEFESPKFSFTTENQHCFSTFSPNFLFSWLIATTPVYKNLNAGASWQYTLEQSSSVFDVGPMVSFTKNAFELQFFAYNPWKQNRYWQFGISVDLASK